MLTHISLHLECALWQLKLISWNIIYWNPKSRNTEVVTFETFEYYLPIKYLDFKTFIYLHLLLCKFYLSNYRDKCLTEWNFGWLVESTNPKDHKFFLSTWICFPILRFTMRCGVSLINYMIFTWPDPFGKVRNIKTCKKSNVTPQEELEK